MEEREIAQQRKEVFDQPFHVKLVAACTVGKGILRLDELEAVKMIETFDQLEEKPSFFVPASGSGSRMFKFLYDWLESGLETKEVQYFIESLNTLAVAKKFRTNEDPKSFVKRLLDEGDINIGNIPKGLIPFHIYENHIETPFQEHVNQASELLNGGSEIHFTIQEEYRDKIEQNIAELELNSEKVNVSYSYQEEKTNAFCFDEDKALVMENDQPLKRPAGHGALLSNLNAVDADIVLIKNIDNIQHRSKSSQTVKEWKKSVGLLTVFKKELLEVVKSFSAERLEELNAKYMFLSLSELGRYNASNIHELADRPTRICGMVKNEGEPGGGPFWIESEGVVTKQIVEKIQIANQTDQRKIVEESSHFNPVFIAVSKSDLYGNSLDLNDFVDDSKYFVVEKSHKGKKVIYRELPGLWNGSMSNWNSIFLEIPTEVFSPVKSLLDLNSRLHKA